MTTPGHDCADHFEVVDAEVDKVTGHLWQYLRCTVCGKRDGHIDHGGSDTVRPTPADATYCTGRGGEVSP